jgi:hypothetical protein
MKTMEGFCFVMSVCLILENTMILVHRRRSQWPRGLRHGSAASRLLGLRVRIPPGHGCLSVVSVGCLSGRGLCNGLITRPEESY